MTHLVKSSASSEVYEEEELGTTSGGEDLNLDDLETNASLSAVAEEYETRRPDTLELVNTTAPAAEEELGEDGMPKKGGKRGGVSKKKAATKKKGASADKKLEKVRALAAKILNV